MSQCFTILTKFGIFLLSYKKKSPYQNFRNTLNGFPFPTRWQTIKRWNMANRKGEMFSQIVVPNVTKQIKYIHSVSQHLIEINCVLVIPRCRSQSSVHEANGKRQTAWAV